MMRRALFAVLFLTGSLGIVEGADLYTTEFEAFPVGDNKWAGTEGWISNDMSSGAQGIVEDFVANLPLGKTAYLGFERPASALTTIARRFDHDPTASGVSRVEFDSLLGIQDSSNGRRDRFVISFYDIGGTFLAGIVFDNASATAKLLRWQGAANGSIAESDTGLQFIRGDPDPVFGFVSLQILQVLVDLANNTWTARLGGLPLFEDAPFTDPALAPLSLGSIAAEWELSASTPATAGDNWLFVADWNVRSAPRGTEPFRIQRISRSAGGDVTLTWLGEPGFDYQVSYSNDLQSWNSGLPNSAVRGVTSGGPLLFTDPDPDPNPEARTRYYRVERTVTP